MPKADMQIDANEMFKEVSGAYRSLAASLGVSV
jgi:hypothetical protein